MKKRREGFFFEKKKQKTLLCWAMGVGATAMAQHKQKFLRRF